MSVEHEFQQRAEAGDGSYAIAYSILRLAAAMQNLGTGNAATSMGAIEFLAAQVGEKLDGAAQQIAEAIELYA